MPRLAIRAGFFISLSLLAACSQGPVPVELKGQNNYTHTSSGNGYAGDNSYRGGAPAYLPPDTAMPPSTQQNAAVQPIGVNDLAAPPANPQPAPVANNSAAPVNPWTNKPHFGEAAAPAPAPVQSLPPVSAQPVANFNAQPAQPVAQLDNIIAKDNDAKPLAAASVAAPVVAPTPQQQAKSGKFLWPVASHAVLSAFGPKGAGKSNDGINIASGEGEPVWAAADGEVVYAGNELKGYGNMVLIKHAGNKSTSYAHLSRYAVDKYDRVKKGQIIGYVGATGNVKEPQLHFAVREGKEPVNPEKYLN